MPILPGSPGVLTAPEEALELAAKIGYPVILKASAGGGGRGMRIVQQRRGIARPVRAGAERGGRGFSSADVYLEKFIGAPRHIEFQVLADEHGNVEILGERECSIQRRHQKLMEESPSPAVTDEQRAEISAVLRKAHRGGGVHQRRHGRIPDGRDRQALLHRGERARSGGAPGDGVRDRHRHREEPDPDRAGRDAGRHPAGPGDAARPLPSSAASMRRIRTLSCLRPAASPGFICRAASACGWIRGHTRTA